MAVSKSTQKRIRTSEKEHKRNQGRKSAVKTWEKKLKKAVGASDKEAAEKSFKAACSKLDKAVKAGALHPNKVARKKSQLAKQVAKAGK